MRLKTLIWVLALLAVVLVVARCDRVPSPADGALVAGLSEGTSQ